MGKSDQVVVGAKFYDWQVSANVEVVDVDRSPLYPKCKVVHSGVEYVARIDALEPPREE